MKNQQNKYNEAQPFSFARSLPQISRQQPVHTDKNTSGSGLFYTPCWQLTSIPSFSTRQFISSSTWLFFIDDSFVGDQLIAKLQERNHVIIFVNHGDAYKYIDSCHFYIRPHNYFDYVRLFQQICQNDMSPQHIVHCWSLQTDWYANLTSIDHQKSLEWGFCSVLFMTQALIKQFHSAFIQMTLLVDQVQVVTGNEHIHPEQAPLLGICHAITQEYNNIQCRVIDIDVPEAGMWNGNNLIDLIVNELIQPWKYIEVAYRNQQRWERYLKPLSLPSAERSTCGLRHKGVYLITSGLSGLGLILAEYLAQTYQAQMIFIERTAFPVRELWQDWLQTHPKQDRVCRQIRCIQRCELMGARILIYRANITNLHHMQKLLEFIDRSFNTLHGVFHYYGTTMTSAFTPIQYLTRELCEQYLEPKLQGTLILDKVLAERQLDFCLLLSSVTSLLGRREFMPYSASNAFFDAYACARYHQSNKSCWISVNWDIQLVRNERIQGSEVDDSISSYSVKPAEALDMLIRALQISTSPHIIQFTDKETKSVVTNPFSIINM